MTLKMAGIRIKIDFFFIFILVSAALAGFLNEVLSLALALGFHEMGHLLSARELGLKVDELELLPFGGRIKIKSFDEALPEHQILTALAGPMFNFAASVLLFYLISQKILSGQIGNTMINYQLILGFFNLVPALPLDGGRIFVVWLRRYLNYLSAIRIACRVSKIISMLLVVAAVVQGVFLKRFLLNFVIAGIFLFAHALKEENEAPAAFIKQVAKKRESLLKKGCLPIESAVATGGASVRDVLYMFTPHRYFLLFIVDDQMHIKKYLTETEIFNKILQQGLDIKVDDLI
jgi:stage IV sporulation protein FB